MNRRYTLMVSIGLCCSLLLAGLAFSLGSGAAGRNELVAARTSPVHEGPTPVPTLGERVVGSTDVEASGSIGGEKTGSTSSEASGSEGSKTTGSSPVVLSYYVPYDATSWRSLQANADHLDYVAAQWVSVDSRGNITSKDDRAVLNLAREKGITVLPSLLTSTGSLNHSLLTNNQVSDHFLNEIVSYVVDKGYEGFDLDLEGVDAGDRDAYTRFVANLAEALHSRGKLLTLAIPAKTSDTRTGWAGPYDYAALGRHADHILLMTYDFHWPTSGAGSVAPRDWVDKVAAYAASQMPPEKVLIGLAFYGYDWNVSQGGRATSVQYPRALALAEQYGAEIVRDPQTGSATFRYAPSARGAEQTPKTAPEREVWLEDAASVADKLAIAERHGIGGVGAWRLGQEDPAVWPFLADYRSVE